jgi:serine/threonine protein kinase
MSNDNPPRACLADFGFMTMVLDPSGRMSCSAQLEGGTVIFMSPELLVPGKFGITGLGPTPEADIYAFGLVIYQVCEQDRGSCNLFTLARSSRVKSRSLAFGWWK